MNETCDPNIRSELEKLKDTIKKYTTEGILSQKFQTIKNIADTIAKTPSKECIKQVLCTNEDYKPARISFESAKIDCKNYVPPDVVTNNIPTTEVANDATIEPTANNNNNNSDNVIISKKLEEYNKKINENKAFPYIMKFAELVSFLLGKKAITENKKFITHQINDLKSKIDNRISTPLFKDDKEKTNQKLISDLEQINTLLFDPAKVDNNKLTSILNKYKPIPKGGKTKKNKRSNRSKRSNKSKRSKTKKS